MSSPPPTILFAGGGTGGHLFPNLAIAERFQEQNKVCRCHFLVSRRPIDEQILSQQDVLSTALPAQPWPSRWWDWLAIPRVGFAWMGSVRQIRQMLRKENVIAVVATGGFVSAPAVWAAGLAGVPVAMVNLDTPAGRANRFLAGWAMKVFSVDDGLPQAQRIGLPLRRSAVGGTDQSTSRRQLGLDPLRRTLLVTGGSQGARTVNQMMVQLVKLPEASDALTNWQVLHLVGGDSCEPICDAYTEQGVVATVRPFCDQMGLAWSAADLAISRAGAGSVAEAWANGTPTLFLPYPHHKDQHQRHNAMTLVHLGGAQLQDDQVDPTLNAMHLATPLVTLMTDHTMRQHMRSQMQSQPPQEGASTVARWLAMILEAR